MNIKILFLNYLLYLIFHVLVKSIHTRFVFPGSSNFCVLLPIYLISCLSCFLIKLPHLCCPSDVLILHYCHTLLKIVISSTQPPVFRQCHRLQPVYHCGSHCTAMRAVMFVSCDQLHKQARSESYPNKVQVNCINNSCL